jgi:Uncharacterised nucleotidyltransferase
VTGEAHARTSAERLGRALVELTRRPEDRSCDPRALLERIPADRLVDRARHHRVPGVLYRSLAALGVDDERFAGLRAAYQMATLSHGRCLVELESVARALDGSGRPWLVVKGPVLATLAYDDPGDRLYEDLDLVVRAEDLPAALRGLEEAGGRVTDLNWPLMLSLRRAELPMALAGGMVGDLHWHLLVTPNARARFDLPLVELFERRRTVRLGGTGVATLDGVDGLVYLCLHASLAGGGQLVWLKDLDQTMRRQELDWDDLVRRARRYRADLVAAMQLERARVVLGAPVPRSVPAALAGGRAWWRWWRTREAKAGMARWGSPDYSDSRYVGATSHGSVASAAELARMVAADASAHYLHRPRRSTGDHPDAESPALYRSDGAAGARAEYLRSVETGSWS